MPKRKFRCSECGHTWEVAYGAPRPAVCPKCKSVHLHRAEEDRGYALRGKKGIGRGGGFGGPKVGGD